MFSHRHADTLATDRRWGFFAFNLCWWVFGGILMGARITATGWTLGSAGLFALFLILQAQVVYGFSLAVTGWWVLRRGGDPIRISQTLPLNAEPKKLPPTAVIIPIYNEDVGRVFQALKIMFESLKATGRGEAFDFFILSDSSDANVWIAEEKAWLEACKEVGGFGRIFYRKRRISLHHKSGNVADFCRRWGSNYKYLLVLDADSIMAGQTMVRLAALMERNPQVGIIQTQTRIVLGETLFQRINQFASWVYGPVFVAGANFWQLDNASFYGHNGIIRVKPFMQFCAMPELPPSGKLGTRILSHDTVEAALIRRAGFDVWADYDLEGSYEGSPPHLLASLQRDRRWCHGNLQHLWFLVSPGLTMTSRLNILNGIAAYVSSPLWLLFLLFSPILFVGGHMPTENVFLFVCSMGLLLTPKVLGVLHVLSQPQTRRAAGGGFKIFISMLGETIYSMILAPILMLFYTRFIWSSFFGASVGWGRQTRDDEAGPSWGECTMAHGANMLLALAAGGLVVWLLPAMLPWLVLVLVGPMVAIPFTRLIASGSVGAFCRRQGWFLIPEETQPPEVLQQLQASPVPATHKNVVPDLPAEDYGLVRAALDPALNALHISLLRERQHIPLHTHERMTLLCDRLLQEGPTALPAREKKTLLWDADAMQALHEKLWACPASQWHEQWQKAFQNYIGSLSN